MLCSQIFHLNLDQLRQGSLEIVGEEPVILCNVPTILVPLSIYVDLHAGLACGTKCAL